MILVTRICMTVRKLLSHILKLIVSIKVNFKYYWSPKTGIPLEYTSEDILFTGTSMLVRSCRKYCLN